MDFAQSWSNLKWVCIWFAIVYGALSLALAVGVAIRCRSRFATFIKAWFGVLAALAAVVGVYALVLTCRQMVAEGEFVPQLFYPIGATMLWAVVSALILIALRFLAPTKVRPVGLACSVVFGVGLIATIVVIGKYYVDVVRDSGYYENVSTIALVVGAVLLALGLAAVAIFCGRKTDKTEQTRSIVFAGVSVALSFALSYVTFFKMPQGGSITLASMLPLLIYSYRYGTRRGILAGLVYGLLQAVQDPWIIHPAQFLLDYPLAFAMLGLAGFVRELRGKGGILGLILGGVCAILMRYVSHVISGIFAFSSYAMPGYGAVAWGFLYNTFALVDGAISLALGAILYVNKAVRRLVYGEQSVPLALHHSHVLPAEQSTDADASSSIDDATSNVDR